MVEEEAAGSQQLRELLGVAAELVDADVLDHADAGDLVVRAVVDLAVVGDADLDPVAEPGVAHALAGDLGLRLGQRDADAAHAVVLGGVQEQRPPAAADVEQALARLEPQLAADDLELALLRGLERLVGRREVRARVDEARPEEAAVERVRDVVVVVDHGTVARERVAAAAAAELARRDRRTADGVATADRERARGEEREVARRGPDAREPVTQGEHGLEVAVEVEVAGDERAGQPELVGLVQQLADRGAADPEHADGLAGGGDPGAVPQLDVERQRGERTAGHAREQAGGDRAGGGRGNVAHEGVGRIGR